MVQDVDDLVVQARSDSADVRARALHTLVQALTDDDELTRSDAADALGPLRHLPAGPMLTQLARTDPSAVVRASAVESLGDLADPSHSGAVLAALRADPDEAVRAYAAASGGILELSDADLAAAAASEVSPWVRGELTLARFRRGGVGAASVVAQFIGVDEIQALRLLNGLDDLVNRGAIRVSPADLAVLQVCLTALAERLPATSGQVQAIIRRWTAAAGR